MNENSVKDKWSYKRNNARRVGIVFELSIEEYSKLIDEAGISHNDIGRGLGRYCLARYGDVGPYAYGNCRFILQEDNLKEQSNNQGRGAANEKNGISQSKLTKINSAGRRSQSTAASRSFSITSPTGEVFNSSNLKLFCVEHSLCEVNMGQVCLGRDKAYKGWTGHYTDKGQFK